MNRFAISLLAGLATFGYASGTTAADLIIDTMPDLAGVVETSTGTWYGVFVGVFGGYAGGTATSPINFDLNGQLLGVNVGANFTLSNGIVAGVVGDLAWSNLTDAGVFAPPSAFDVNWTGSIADQKRLEAQPQLHQATGPDLAHSCAVRRTRAAASSKLCAFMTKSL